MGNDDKIHIKQPKTYEEQIELFKKRGLIIEDEASAITILSKINYYRFSAYTLTLKKDNVFHENASFDQIYSLYEFDRKLRLELLSSLEQIEISFRTKISYYLAHKYGSTPHLDVSNFKNESYFNDMTRQIKGEINRSKELFIIHHQEKYESVFPIWVVIEVTSFSLLSKIYSNLKDDDQDDIADFYNNKRFFIRNWLYALSTLRNICAHFGRLYNRHLPIHFKLAKEDRKKLGYGNTTFSAIFVICKILSDKTLLQTLMTNISALIEEYEHVDISQLGFPENWRSIVMGIIK
ncbi:MAG TPA: Abi family protein [Sporosarcina sp.]|nr:Abi family protein [Sporosarcina sp.]